MVCTRPVQDASNLEPGGYYLDRKPQTKHLWGGGTAYKAQDAKKLWDSLSQLTGLPP